MKFHWASTKTKVGEDTAFRIVELGQKICGLQIKGSRPQTVELTYQELKYLIQNPGYALKTVLLALSYYTDEKKNNADST